MAHNPIFQTECKVNIDGKDYYGDIIQTSPNTSTYNTQTNSSYQKDTDSLNYMNDFIKRYMNL